MVTIVDKIIVTLQQFFYLLKIAEKCAHPFVGYVNILDISRDIESKFDVKSQQRRLVGRLPVMPPKEL